MGEYEVVMEGGGPWGIRLQGGKDFGVQLNVARVTPGSKASLKGVLPGDIIQSINGQDTETLTHMEAQNLIKAAGARLQLGLKQGKSTPQDDKDGGSSGFAAQPKQTLYTTNINHSAGVDHKYNAKPKSFISSTNSSVGGVSHVSVPVKKFDPGEYARKKKEELDRYKEEKPVVDSDVLKMLQKTTVQDKNNAGLQKSEEGKQNMQGNVAFRMTADGTDLADVSPGSRAIMEDIKNRGTSSLSSSGAASGGSRSFRILQHLTSHDEEVGVPVPPPLPPTSPGKPVFGMAAPNPYNLPIKAVVGEGGNPILDALKGKMKEMNIDAEKIDRSSSVSSDDRGKFLSQSSRDAAARPLTPTTPIIDNPLAAPKSPSMFRASIKGGGNPTGVQGANELMSSLKNRVQGDRMTLGLKQTRGLSPSQRKLDESQGFLGRGVDHNANTLSPEIDLPPPPPELMGNLDQDDEEAVHQVQSNTFRMLQQHVEAGTGDQVPTGLDKPRNHSHGSLPQPMVRNVPRFDPHRETTTTVDPIPKAPFPSGPNFKVGKPSAPSFKSSSTSSICSKGPPPPAVNAGEIVNPNSRLYQTGAYPAGGLLNDDYVRSHVNSTQDDFGRTRVNSQDDFGWGRMGSGSNIAPQNFNNRRPSGNEASCPTSPSPRGQPAQSGEKKLVCQTCQESLNGPFVSAIGKTWHPDHFCCSSCKVSLQNQAFVEENNQLFCEKCYNQFYAPKCAHCNNAIIGDYGNLHDAICDICSSVASSRGVYDPIVCSKSINWLKKQIGEANAIYEISTRKREEEQTRYLEAKQKMMSYNKKRAMIEEQIEHQDRDWGNMKKMVDYKLKVHAANANICVKAENFDEKIQQVETNLISSREKLNGWQTKLTAVVEDYRDKRNRLEEIKRRKKESHGRVNALESELLKMEHHMKVLNGKKSFRKMKLEASEQELESIEEEIKEAESRQMLSEQHVVSLGIYKETIEHEYRQQKIHTKEMMNELKNMKLIKQKILQNRNVGQSAQLVQ